LAVGQLTALLRVADRRIVPSIAICSFAGLRSAECENLDWKYIDLDRRIITILENVSKTGGRKKTTHIG
jgi:integrase